MLRKLPRSARIILIVFLQSIVVGVLIGALRADQGEALEEAALGALIGGLIGFGCTFAEVIIFSNAALRWVPPVVFMVLRTLVFGGFILMGLLIPTFVTGADLPWAQEGFAGLFLICGLVALAFSIGIEVVRLLGSEATLALISARYARPRLEDRVILFADLAGSTALAERIGELRFHAYLQDVALDLAQAINATNGNVYRYVGDGVIATWPLLAGTKSAACLRCAEQIHAGLKRRASHYQSRYGDAPSVRIAIHCGPVAVGEMGDWKKEIALLGDVMNTTARIEVAAKSLNAQTVLSEALCHQLPEPARATLKRLPDFAAAGKADTLVLWTPDARALS